MNRLRTLATLAVVASASLAAVACGPGKKPAPAAQPAPSTQPAKPGVPALTAAQMSSIKKVFDEARVWAEEARKHRLAGEEAMRADGPQAAIPHFQEAKPLYFRASQHVEEWIEPDFGKITVEQRDAYLGPELHELSKWQHEMASMGKVPPKD